MEGRNRMTLVALVAAVLWLGGIAGCNLDRQCNSICERYQDCFDSEYDVRSCTDRCVRRAREDEEFEERLRGCENCVEDQACAESFDCVDECAGIVP